jgi:hypothetical protein
LGAEIFLLAIITSQSLQLDFDGQKELSQAIYKRLEIERQLQPVVEKVMQSKEAKLISAVADVVIQKKITLTWRFP